MKEDREGGYFYVNKLKLMQPIYLQSVKNVIFTHFELIIRTALFVLKYFKC